MKKFLSILLALVMVFSLMASAAFADNETTTPGTEIVDPEPSENPEPPVEPEVPTIEVTASNNPTSGKVVLTWAAVDGAAKYEVYRSGTKDGEYKLYYTTTKLTYTNTSAYAGYWYHYKVKALDADGNEIVTSAIITQCSDCAAPVITAGNNASTGKVTLKWKAVYGAEKYAIYRATARDGEYVRQYTTTSTSYTNTTSKANVTYYYKVMALATRTASANSAFSSVAARTCDLAAPVVKASNNAETGKVVLTWKPIEGAAKYEVYRSGTKDGTYKLYCTLTGTTYTNSTANAGYTYYYKVKAISVIPEANSAFSSIVSRTCDCGQIFDCETSYNDDGKVVFNWDTRKGATSYKIYRSGYQNGTYKLIGETKSNTFTDKTASAGYYYYYKIVAVNSRSSYADSAPYRITAATTIPAVKNLRDASTSSKLVLKWDAVKGADGYLVYAGPIDSDGAVLMDDVTSPAYYGGTKFTARYAVVAYKDCGNDRVALSPVKYITIIAS